MLWSVQERAHAVEVYAQQGSTARALRALRREWGRGFVPDRHTLMAWVRGFKQVGSVPGAPRRGRARGVAAAAVSAVQRAIRRKPRLSVRRLAAKTGLSRSRVQRILRQQLRVYPYKLQLVQRLHRGDRAKRLQFGRWLLEKWKVPPSGGLCSLRMKLIFI